MKLKQLLFIMTILLAVSTFTNIGIMIAHFPQKRVLAKAEPLPPPPVVDHRIISSYFLNENGRIVIQDLHGVARSIAVNGVRDIVSTRNLLVELIVDGIAIKFLDGKVVEEMQLPNNPFRFLSVTRFYPLGYKNDSQSVLKIEIEFL